MEAESGPPQLHIGADGVAQITLRRPQHLNRLHREDLLALQDHLRTLRDSPAARVLVLRAEGRAFCAGFNIAELKGPDDPRLFEHTVDALEALPLPTIARLNGSVYGGATDLALACDFRVGVPGLELRMPAAALGLHYYPSGLQRYVSRLGLNAAKRLFLLAEATPAAELLQLGYLTALAAPEALDAEVQRLAARLASLAPLALQGMKRSLNEIAAGDDTLGAIRERELRCAASADLQEGLTAFAEKRPPRFQAR